MRIAIGRLWQETNGFSPVLTTLENFKAMGIYYGQEILEKFKDVTELGGFIQAARDEKDIELIPTFSAGALPSGKCDRKTHQFLKEKLLEGLRKAGRLDGILLALHGAMIAEDEYDVEGDLLGNIRTEWGNQIPIVISLDHHANITKKMVELCTAMVGYRTCPHVDMLETGYKAAKIMLDAVRGKIEPVVKWRKIPMIAVGNLLAPAGPLGEFFRQAESFEKTRKAVSVSIFPEHSLNDNPELGWSVVVVTDGEPELAQEIANQLAKVIWEKRDLFLPEKGLSAAEAVEKAIGIEGGPIVLADAADAPGAGAPGDSNAILKELLGKKLKGKAMLTVVDPEAVEKAIKAGIGKEVTLEVGGRFDTVRHKPVKVTGRVRAITDGRFVIRGEVLKGVEQNMGCTVVLEIGDIEIVISETAALVHELSPYRSVGLEPTEAKIVVVKSPFHFRKAYEPIAKEIILVDAPGSTALYGQSFANLFKKIKNRPLYPLDQTVSFKL